MKREYSNFKIIAENERPLFGVEVLATIEEKITYFWGSTKLTTREMYREGDAFHWKFIDDDSFCPDEANAIAKRYFIMRRFEGKA